LFVGFLGTALESLERHEEALQAFNKSIELNPKYVVAHYNKGSLSFFHLHLFQAPIDLLSFCCHFEFTSLKNDDLN
jgi:tetratricopeptide (TPR) repeat protein